MYMYACNAVRTYVRTMTCADAIQAWHPKILERTYVCGAVT